MKKLMVLLGFLFRVDPFSYHQCGRAQLNIGGGGGGRGSTALPKG